MSAEKTNWDRILACVLAVLVFVSGILYCDTNHTWGDDYAAYMLQGKAIAEGTVQQQTKENLLLHPGEIYGEDFQSMKSLVYVWGFPLQLAAIYRLVGFDVLTSQQSILYYKIPGCLSLGLLAGILFLFFRRRFRTDVSMLLTVFLVLSIFPDIQNIHTDLPFLCMTFCSFYLYETLWERTTKKEMVIHAVALGISMCYACLLRLNGTTVILIIAAMHIFKMVYTPECRSRILYHCLAYVVFAVLLGAFYLVFPYPTSNSGDIGLGDLLMGTKKNYWILSAWLSNAVPFGSGKLIGMVTWGLKLCCVIGFLSKGRKAEFGYAVFLAGTLLVTASLPYHQGVRYLYGILPLIVMFIADGVSFIYDIVCKYLKQERLIRGFACLGFVCVVLFAAVELKAGCNAILEEREQRKTLSQDATDNAYAESCLEVYRFIREETEADAVFAFLKPRALYLNTGKLSFRPNVNGHRLQDADYYVWFKPWEDEEEEVIPQKENRMKQVFRNSDFIIYRVKE